MQACVACTAGDTWPQFGLDQSCSRSLGLEMHVTIDMLLLGRHGLAHTPDMDVQENNPSMCSFYHDPSQFSLG